MNAAIVLFALFWASTPASAQQGDPSIECERGVKEACWMIRFGRCAHQNPRIAIPACTRQLSNPTSVWDNSALSALKRADQAQRYSLRATAYAKQGNAEQALEDFDRAIRSHGELYWIHALRASALYAAGFEQGALASFNDAIALAPDNPLLLNARARLLSTALDENVRNSAQAIVDAQRANALAPGRPNFVAALATVYAESGDFENAVAAQRRAVDLIEPSDRNELAGYMDRLALYEQGMTFERPFMSCGTDDNPSDPDARNYGSVLLPYLAFCFENGR